MRRLHDGAATRLRDAFELTRWSKLDRQDPRRREDEEWLAELEEGPWHELLEAELRRLVLGPRRVDGGRFIQKAMGSPTFQVVADMQRRTYGVGLIEQVRLRGHRAGYVQKWIDTLVEVRNHGVHRGETPGPLDTTGVRSWIGFVRGVAHELDRHVLAWADEELPLGETK